VTKTIKLYPESEQVAYEHVLAFFNIIVAYPEATDTEIILQLTKKGIGRIDSELVLRLVPCAMGAVSVVSVK
jgi:hypothetical protein